MDFDRGRAQSTRGTRGSADTEWAVLAGQVLQNCAFISEILRLQRHTQLVRAPSDLPHAHAPTRPLQAGGRSALADA
jgi:hypothetical protein